MKMASEKKPKKYSLMGMGLKLLPILIGSFILIKFSLSWPNLIGSLLFGGIFLFVREDEIVLSISGPFLLKEHPRANGLCFSLSMILFAEGGIISSVNQKTIGIHKGLDIVGMVFLACAVILFFGSFFQKKVQQ